MKKIFDASVDLASQIVENGGEISRAEETVYKICSFAGAGEVNVFIIPSLIYERKRKFSVVTITLTAATLIISAVSLLINRYLLFPFYMQGGAAAFFADVWYLIVLFNLIKGASNAVITVLLYKRLKKILHKFL